MNQEVTFLVQIDFEFPTEKGGNVSAQYFISETGLPEIVKLVQNKNTEHVFMQTGDGDVYQVPLTPGGSPSWLSTVYTRFPTKCTRMNVITMNDQETVVGLDQRSKLYLNENLVSTECNSFGLHSEFFAYTTLTHQMRFMSLNRSVQDNVQILKEKRKYDNTLRDLEQGSAIVVITPKGSKTVLQMPRGNLETIDPLALSLSITNRFLSEHKYADAFAIMRRGRINLNLLYDHSPKNWKSHIHEFVTQINNQEYLNIFINDLQDEDFTKAEYFDPWAQAQAQAGQQGPGGAPMTATSSLLQTELPFLAEVSAKQETTKSNIICDALYSYLEKDGVKKTNYLSLLTCLVKYNPPKVEEALTLVQQLKAQETALAESALKYLIFLVDVNKLFNIALGMYDFSLVLMVAAKSQKDPKEYLPFLAELQAMKPEYQKYKINMHLEKFDKALEFLAQAGDEYFPTCLELIENKNLWNTALIVFKDKKQLNEVREKYADLLEEQHNHVSAALLYSQCGQVEKAISAYQVCGHWKKALYLAQSIGLPNEEIKKIARDLAEGLITNYGLNEAAVIFEQYLDSPSEAVETLLSGGNFEEALRLIHKYGLQSMIEKDLIPALTEVARDQLARITTKHKQFVEKYNRLLTVRYEKLIAERDNLANEEWKDIDSASMYSYESRQSRRSNATWTTNSTRGSSATKSRRNKKKLSGRKGNPFEQEYLITELTNAIPSKRWQEEVKELLRTLIFFNKYEEARNLQTSFSNFLAVVQSGLPLINTPKVLSPEEEETEMLKARARHESPYHPELIHATTTSLHNIEAFNWKSDLL
eukprot:TRINITY_DN2628_c0_g1_i1.p1 TRINITY_DN2628_c0_g1~~TRINITY_DN2628_c0_g1_i1.p1  ORF type:complete len:817 (-),score=216.60 TRINITY_DN2628_c0_g1_i1:24-2474(-)